GRQSRRTCRITGRTCGRPRPPTQRLGQLSGQRQGQRVRSPDGRLSQAPKSQHEPTTHRASQGASMDRMSIVGGRPLNGTIAISGAKNAALPLMIASLLTPERLTLKNVPNLADVSLLARILRNHGVDLTIDGKRGTPAPYLGETFHLTARDIVD